jgi:hypothetical protein
MIAYVSGATATLRRLGAPHKLGHLITPNTGNDPLALVQTGRQLAVDNAAFSGFNHRAFMALVNHLQAHDVWYDWLAVPDVVGNALATLWLFHEYLGLVLDADPDRWPVAFIGQDGAEDLDLDDVWGCASCWFIGGSTEWKLSAAAADLVQEARRRGLWVHMGRVNTFGRLQYAYEIGCDSIDGTGVSKWPEVNLPILLRWLGQLDARPFLHDGQHLSHGEQER